MIPLRKFTDDGEDAALNGDASGGHDDGLHFGVGGLQANHIPLKKIMLQGGLRAVDQRDDYLALASGLGFFDQHIVTMHDVVVTHRLSADFKRKDGFVVDNIVQRQAIAIFHRLQRATGGDAAHQGNFEAGGCFALGQHIDGAAVIVGATEQTFSLQVGDVFVDGGQGLRSSPEAISSKEGE